MNQMTTSKAARENMMKKINKRWLFVLGVLFVIGMFYYSFSFQEDTCASKIILRTGRGLGFRQITYVVCADGTGEIKYKLPRGLGDHPEWSPDGEWIVYDTFESIGYNESQLFLYNIHEKKEILVDENLYGAIYPSWSPDGTQIIFDGIGGLFLLDVTCVYTGEACDFEPQFLVEGMYPSWSYDGQYVAFTVYGDDLGQRKLQIVNLENLEDIIDLTPENASSCVEPDWSPVENKLVARCAGDNSDIFVFDLDRGGYTNLTEGSLASNYAPQWSPDGSKIAFITRRDADLEKCLNVECSVSAEELYVMDSDGENPIRVSFYTDEIIHWFAWIPE